MSFNPAVKPPDQIPFCSETILPAQWEDTLQESPERRLCLAVLSDAWKSLQGRATLPRGSLRSHPIATLFCAREAEEWFLSDATTTFSFCFVCEALGLDPEWFRKKMKAEAIFRAQIGARG